MSIISNKNNKVVLVNRKREIYEKFSIKELTIINSERVGIMNAIIGKLNVINSSHILIAHNTLSCLNIYSEPPEMKGLFKKRKLKKWINKYGSRDNTIISNIIHGKLFDKSINLYDQS